MTELVLPAYNLNESNSTVETFGSGLINNTWKVSAWDKHYILQRINTDVFKEPEAIAENISLIASYLKKNYPAYPFIAPIVSMEGKELITVPDNGCFRMFPFVEGSCSFDVVETPELAFEAAVQFGRFTKLLSGINICKLRITIPQFHDLGFRNKQFLQALATGNRDRIAEANECIGILKSNADIITGYEQIRHNPEFKIRVTHHDTKISNVLFDSNNKGLCVIDLDTVMPGYFFSDVGDMIRTYLSPVSEEEKDFGKIVIRKEYYKAIVHGYLGEMKDELTETEKQYFFYAGKFSIYMQALRFLTDYLNNDKYYGAAYPDHNLVRAANQIVLLQKLIEAEPELQKSGINN